jgi:hypothetical protein
MAVDSVPERYVDGLATLGFSCNIRLASMKRAGGKPSIMRGCCSLRQEGGCARLVPHDLFAVPP